MQKEPVPLWSPPEKFLERSHLGSYMKWLSAHQDVQFDQYDALWKWSVENPEDFWKSIWDYFEILHDGIPETILGAGAMWEKKWFEGVRLNYAEHLFRHTGETAPAILFKREGMQTVQISWQTLKEKSARLQAFFDAKGIRKGDRICAFLPNIPEATYSFIATCATGAVWSSCSPDFGVESVVDRFSQIGPRILIAVDGYTYNGKPFDRLQAVRQIVANIPSIEHVVLIPYLDHEPEVSNIPNVTLWDDALVFKSGDLAFRRVPFDHPIWVLYSSGTTGKPKAITHGHGGVLLEHLKYLHFHNDVHAGEKFFWFSTTGWMMWNFVQAALLTGATIVLYDGSPGYPDLNALWSFAEAIQLEHFGTSAPYLVACMKHALSPGGEMDLSSIRTVSSTGAPLPPEAFQWVYDHVHPDIWLCSMAGGTDVCSAFVGGIPGSPVYAGEIQGRALGCSLFAFDESGKPVEDQLGEMVITRPMPSMPIYFWNDPDKVRYRRSYFEDFPGVWKHGDWVKVTSRGSVVIYGRSDATLNRQGVRIGTAEIYRALHAIAEVRDALIVNLELSGGKHFMPLFVVLDENTALDHDLVRKIKKTLRSACSPRHVPDKIIQIDQVPYTISGKKMEAPIKKILLGRPVDKSLNPDSMRNPEALDFFKSYQIPTEG